MAKWSRRADGRPETKADKKFFDLRESGYKGPIDRHGNKVAQCCRRCRCAQGYCNCNCCCGR